MCTLEKRGNIYVLTITGPGEHRLNPTLLDSIQSSLHKLRAEPASPCSALITTSQGKFFSNGFDLAWARSSPFQAETQSRSETMSSKLRSVVADLISLPMPTIAAVTGHAAAGGMILALAHDYVFMRKDRGFLYMSEVDIGLVIPEWFGALLKSKIGNSRVVREVILKAPKLTADMAADRGVVDLVCGGGAEGTVAAAVEMAEGLVRRGWDGHVYAGNRMVLLEEVLEKVNGIDETARRQNGNSILSSTKSKL